MAQPTQNREIIQLLYKAYIYGYPLVVLDLHTTALTNTRFPTSQKAPINQLIHAEGVADADAKSIVMPNMDTVYTSAYIDLKQGPLYFRKPKADRYTAAEFLDAYGNCIAILGSGGTGGTDVIEAVLVPPDYDGQIPDHFVRIDMPTNLCWTLTRILQNGNDAEEIAAIQKGFDLRPLSAYGKEYVYPQGSYLPENDFIPYERLSSLDIESFFHIFNRRIGDNLGKEPDTGLLESVREYGIGSGQTFRLSAFPPEVQQELVRFPQKIVQQFRENTRRYVYDIPKDGWIVPKDVIANFGTHYSHRAKVAWGGFGANPVTAAIYPNTTRDADGETLIGTHRYVCHFDSLPPVDDFWSLTVYGTDKYLIPNEIHRNGINDRSKFTLNQDGSLDIYLQEERPTEEKVSNWLPIGSREFMVVLRLYSPKMSILDGRWHLPQIRRIP